MRLIGGTIRRFEESFQGEFADFRGNFEIVHRKLWWGI
jgi:hypothetical protein